MVVTMAVIIGIVFGGTVGRAAGGVTETGRTMAVGNGSPARFVGFVAENRGEDPGDVVWPGCALRVLKKNRIEPTKYDTKKRAYRLS